MKAVLFYETAQVEMEQIMSVYPLHKTLVDKFSSDGKIIVIGSYANPLEGSKAIFIDKQSAEGFSKNDSFIMEGIVANVTIKEWNDRLM